MNCPDCGREVSSEAPSCPQCGRPWPGREPIPRRPEQVGPRATYNTNAISSLILAIIGFLLFGITSIIAIPLGIVGLSQLNNQLRYGEPVQKGRGIAITGIVLGVLGVFAGAAAFLSFVAS